MIRHTRTVVALSATDADHALLSYARLLAGLGFARHYHFVHVRTPGRIVQEDRTDADVQRQCEQAIRAEFEFPGNAASWSCHVLTGVRIDSLLEFITRQHCDMALLGHRKSRSGQRSLARRLAMVSPCSVWLVPEGAPVSISGLLVPIDFSDHSADSLSVATSIARAAGLRECTALHVFSDPAMIRYDEQVDEIRHHEEEAFRTFIAPVDCHGIDVRPVFMEGHNIAGTIVYAAQKNGFDLLVMNTRGRSRSASILLGSVTAQVMVETPLAILTVKHYGAMMNLFEALRESHLWVQPNPKTN